MCKSLSGPSINLKNPLPLFFPNFSHWTSIPAPSPLFSSSIPSCRLKSQDWAWWLEQQGALPLERRAAMPPGSVPSDVACHSQLSIPRALRNCPGRLLPVSLTTRGRPGRKHRPEHQSKTKWVNRRGRLEIHSIAFDNQRLER